MLPCDQQKLLEFYTKIAPKCQDLDKQKYAWICKKTGQTCSAKACPNITELFEKTEPPAETPKDIELLTQTSSPKVERSRRLEPAKPGPQVLISRSQSNQPAGRLAGKKKRSQTTIILPNCKIIRRRHSRRRLSNSRSSKKLRARVSFVPKNHPTMIERWSFDVVRGAGRRERPTIYEYSYGCGKRKLKNARFYFPRNATAEEVQSLIGSWFQGFSVHDESARLNTMGAPQPFIVEIEET